ncbi:MAG: HipA N-terminal domain-containing protein [Muribaculaceae bacterium]|nr:HipA N-terminal domain-containing protein [Muribaculaceae bacterium]
MSRSLNIYANNTLAGTLTQISANEYEFVYDADYMAGNNVPLSPTMPFSAEAYRSKHLFPLFANLLPEGANRRTICRKLHIDEHDYFSLLASFAGKDFIGNISISLA